MVISCYKWEYVEMTGLSNSGLCPGVAYVDPPDYPHYTNPLTL